MMLTIANNALTEANRELRTCQTAERYLSDTLRREDKTGPLHQAFGHIPLQLRTATNSAARLRNQISDWQQSVVANFESR